MEREIKQIWKNVKVDNKLIEMGDLDLFNYVFLFIHSPLPPKSVLYSAWHAVDTQYV